MNWYLGRVADVGVKTFRPETDVDLSGQHHVVILNLFIPFEVAVRKMGADESSIPTLTAITNGPLSMVEEVVQTPYLRTIISLSGSMARHNTGFISSFSDCQMEPAFVFDAISATALSDCSRMWNTFLCRYRISEGGVASSYETLTTDRSTFGSNYHDDVWNGICLVQDALRRLLNRMSQSQGLHCKAHSPTNCFQSSVWHYFVRYLDGKVEVKAVPGRRIRQRLLPGLSTECFKEAHEINILRFDTPDKMKLFRDLFGNTSTVGIRRRKPKLNTTNHLRANDILNVIQFPEAHPEAFSRYTNFPGIDLIFAGAPTNTIQVAVRYSKHIFNPRETINCASLRSIIEFATPNTGAVNTLPAIALGSLFEHGNMLLEAVMFDSGTIRTRVKHPRSQLGNMITFRDIEYVKTQVEKYIN